MTLGRHSQGQDLRPPPAVQVAETAPQEPATSVDNEHPLPVHLEEETHRHYIPEALKKQGFYQCPVSLRPRRNVLKFRRATLPTRVSCLCGRPSTASYSTFPVDATYFFAWVDANEKNYDSLESNGEKKKF